MTIGDVRRGLRQQLSPIYGEREAAALAALTITTLKDWSQAEMLANEDREASEFIINRSQEILKQLLNHCPIQYALGQTNFYGLTLKVGPGVLIPRPETEELVDLIIKENSRPDLRVLDLCTGSGAIALALARNLPFSSVEAVDVAPEAVEITRTNAANLKARIDVRQEDILRPDLPLGQYDIIVSNPPYVDESEKADMEPNVLDYEPHRALFVPDDNPLLFYRRIADIGLRSLGNGGKLYLEINPRHASRLRALLENAGYRDVEIIKDIHGKDRFAKAVRPNQ